MKLLKQYKYCLVGMLLSFFSLLATAQEKHTISGYVKDNNGEELIGATVYVAALSAGTVTNTYGFYSLTLPENVYDVTYSFIGYEATQKKVSLQNDTKIDLMLEPSTEVIEEVEITAERKDANIQRVEMSTTKLPIKTIQRIPVLMGETDVIKTIQLLPGVQVAGEGSSGFYVRGGAVDQNLILLDDATVYNPSHIGGFFSVFNGDAIKNVELYKGGIPSNYGGRLSSVLDVRMNEGGTAKFGATGGIGAISSRLTLNGPMLNQKGSYIVSGRRTYIDAFFPLFNNAELKDVKAYFYDLNAKANYNINENNRIFLSAYTGDDKYEFSSFFGMGYGNRTMTLRWNHVFSNKLFANYNIIYSNFDYNLGVPEGVFGFDWESDIIDKSFKNDYTYYLNPQNTIQFGVQATHHTIKPGRGESVGDGIFTLTNLPNAYGAEYGVFVQNEQKVTPKLTLQYGLRFSMFQNIGEGTIYNYDSEYTAIDSSVYKWGNVFNTFNGLEPRFGARYMMNNTSSIKASYNRMFQYMHLATNTASTTPLDVWFMSNPNIKPQYADQVALGYFKNFKDNTYELSVETYYKKMYNAIDFKDHAELFLNEYFDGELRRGSAYSYGMEFYLKKQEGDFTGWISYTLSKTRREIDGINNGEAYPTSYDKPHDLKIVANYDITPRINISANWIYSSAMPLTVVRSWIPLEDETYGRYWVPKYSGRNEVRLKGTDYHRLDIAFTYHFRQKKNYSSSITASVYNAYGRKNLYSIVYRENENNPEDEPNKYPPEMYKMYLFGVIPTVTYNFKF